MVELDLTFGLPTTMSRANLTSSPAFQALQQHCAEMKDTPLCELFSRDPARFLAPY